MANEHAPLSIARGSPCEVGIVPTRAGSKVLVRFRLGLPDVATFWLDPETAQEVGQAIIRAAESIEPSPSAAVN